MLPCRALVEHLVLILHGVMHYPELTSYLSKDQGVKASAAARTDIHTAREAARPSLSCRLVASSLNSKGKR